MTRPPPRSDANERRLTRPGRIRRTVSKPIHHLAVLALLSALPALAQGADAAVAFPAGALVELDAGAQRFAAPDAGWPAEDAGAVVAPPSEADGGPPAVPDVGPGLEATDAGALPLAEVAPDAGALPLAEVAPDAGAGLEAALVPTLGRNQKLPKNFTGVIGRVTDARTGDGLIEATVKVVAGGKKSALTDLEGYYRLKLPPGTYDLRVFYELYQGRRISNVVVKKGEAVTLDVALESDARSVQEVVVEAKADKRNETALLQERKKAAVVQDSIGAQEIARTPDATAGDAAKRVVSVTLVDNRYVYIRGLGGRYAGTLLNNTVMPSPEPDEPSVPLDLFPTALLSNLNVVKTYTPELPGQFGGGSLTIDTSTFPTKLEVKLTAKLGLDTVTTFQDRPAAPTSAGEAFGFRDGARDLPAEVPTDKPLRVVSGEPDSITAEEQQAAGRALPNVWTPTQVLAMPSGSLGAQVGNTVSLGRDRRLGFLAAAQWNRREATRRTQTADVSGSMMGDALLLTPQNPTSSLISSVSASTSGLVNLGLQLDRDNEVSFLALALTNAELEATRAEGPETISANQFQTSNRIQFTQRILSFNQLKGFHRIGALADLEVDWQANYAHVDRLSPDIRDTRYLRTEEEPIEDYLRVNNPYSSDRFFLTLGEDSGGGTVNFTLPWRNFRFKVGAVGQYQARTFDGRRLRFLSNGGAPKPGLAEELFVPENIVAPPARGYRVSEETLAQDRYTSTLAIYGGFGLVEWKPTDWLRGQVGLRYEGSRQTVVTGSPFAPTANLDDVVRVYDNPLPSVNLTFSPGSTVNLRAAYALTLARPSFRELAPFLFFDQVRRRQVSGNRELLQTNIHHGDLRAEWFPGENEVFALSVFGKQFTNPIERVVIGTSLTSDFGFRNAAGAQMLGVELEARTSLGRLSPWLKSVRVGGNASFIWSQIQLDPDSMQLGRGDRPLQGQSPWVANAFITWSREQWGTEVGVFYNVYGPRITEVAALPLPDYYEQPFHKLDVTASQQLGRGFQLKLSVANVLDQAIRIQQGDVQVFRYPPGVQFFASLAWAMPDTRSGTR